MTFLQTIKAILNILFQLCVVFPYNALTIRRQSRLPLFPTDAETRRQPGLPSAQYNAAMISDKVYKLCTSPESVSSLLAKDPTLTPGEAWKKLYDGHAAWEKDSKDTARAHRDQIITEDLKRAAECGKWGPTQPSELFLRVYFSKDSPSIFYSKLSAMYRCTMTLSAHLITAFPEPWSVRR